MLPLHQAPMEGGQTAYLKIPQPPFGGSPDRHALPDGFFRRCDLAAVVVRQGLEP